MAPTEGQTHLTFELTRGVTDRFEMAGYVVLAKRSGYLLALSAEYYGAPAPVDDKAVVFNFGPGVGLTDAGNRTVFKARLGWRL